MGNIAILKFPRESKANEKKKIAEKILRQYKSVRTVLEKTSRFKGRLRKQKTRWILGVKTKEALYRENGCIFRFNVDSTYFSPRLSSERAEISGKIKRNENVLVMFSGINPYGIVIARNSPAGKVTSIEINREAGRYAKLNSKLNKVEDKVQVIQGGVKRLAAYSHSQIGKNYVDKKTNQMVNIKNQRNRRVLASRLNLQEIPKKYDVIVMPRPQLKESFLKEAFFLSKKGTRIFYYDFAKDDEIDSVRERILDEAKKSKKKIKILNFKKAGEIAPYKFRVRVDLKIL